MLIHNVGAGGPEEAETTDAATRPDRAQSLDTALAVQGEESSKGSPPCPELLNLSGSLITFFCRRGWTEPCRET